MIHYNSNNNAYCRAVNAETFQTIQHNPVWISILLHTRNQYSYSHFEIIVCIYSVRGDIDQMSTNTPRYTICSTPIVYIFVYILIETRIAPLNLGFWGQILLCIFFFFFFNLQKSCSVFISNPKQRPEKMITYLFHSNCTRKCYELNCKLWALSQLHGKHRHTYRDVKFPDTSFHDFMRFLIIAYSQALVLEQTNKFRSAF